MSHFYSEGHENMRGGSGYDGNLLYAPFTPSMKEKDFQRLSRFIHERFGICVPPAKKFMLESRLFKRLRKLEMRSFDEYCTFLFSEQGMERELVQMVDMVTTNKTSFFRESAHFDYLLDSVLPELVHRTGAGLKRSFLAWSAGCSSGEEPFTIAMILAEFARKCEGFTFRVVGTDISSRVLEKASIGIYDRETAESIPFDFRKRYLLRSKDRSSDQVRIIPELRNLITFQRLNFMEEEFPFREPFDIIFCRNVIIYFDRETQKQLLLKLCKNLRGDGLLFMGHSETLNDLRIPVRSVFPSVYRKQQ